MKLYFYKISSKSKIISNKKYLEEEMNLIKKIYNKKLMHNKNGKPYIINDDYISITNNNKIIVVAGNKSEVGIDLQLINEKKLSIDKTRLFSMKEALYKCNNIPFDIINKLNIQINKYNIIKIDNKIYKLFSKILSGYVLSICYEIKNLWLIS